jgi:hypothetical protein
VGLDIVAPRLLLKYAAARLGVVARIKVHATQNTAAFHKLCVSDERGNGTAPSSCSGA